MINQYRSSLINHSLNDYVPRNKSKGVIALTSIMSNNDTDKSTQIKYMLELYDDNPEGLTDAEMSTLLRMKNINIPNSTISARRNDINQQYLKTCDRDDLESNFLLVSSDKRSNPYSPYRSAMVWKINERIKNGMEKN